MNRLVVWTFAALLLAPLPLRAQGDPGERIAAARQRAVAAGVPAALLDLRVAEGRAKRVPEALIAAAVERRAASLIEARAALAPVVGSPSNAELAAGAEAVEAGIRGQPLRAVIEQARSEDRPVAIAVLTYLHRDQRIPVDQALAQVQGALRKGPRALEELPAQAAAARARDRGAPGATARPDHAGQGRGGPPETVPAPGSRPGAGKTGNGKPAGTPGGKTGG